MQEHIRALLVILFLGLIGFYLVKKIIPKDIPPSELSRWRNIWFAVLISAFVSNNFWLYILSASFLIILLAKKINNKTALFFILLFVIPPIAMPVPGMGMVNYLISLNHIRFISLLVLLPAALALMQKNDFKFGKAKADKFLLLYIFFMIALEFRDTTLTDGLRKCFYMVTDILLPYYVFSRGIKDLPQMRKTICAFLATAIVMSVIAMFENIKHWLLYNSLGAALGASSGGGLYLGRSGELRVLASFGHSIVLGYFMAVAFGCYLYINTSIKNTMMRRLGFLLIAIGLFIPLSRGPWVGALIIYIVFILQGKGAFKKLGKLILAGIIALPILAMIPGGQKYINLIPYFGTAEQANVHYRERVFDNSIIVIKRNLLLGSSNYIQAPEMQELKQGQGIIDIVNSYILVTLESGIVGLSLFLSIFISVLCSIRSRLKQIKDNNLELHTLGRCLLAIIVGIMLVIYTVSSIMTVPIIYWSMLGLGLAFTRLAL